MITRVIRFQSSLIDAGITGWRLTYAREPFSDPKLKSPLNWKGTLISEATGLESFFACSSALSSARERGAHSIAAMHKVRDCQRQFFIRFIRSPAWDSLQIEAARHTDAASQRSVHERNLGGEVRLGDIAD